jgi:hypothetical protein
MKEAALVYPMFAMVLLTATVVTILFRSRVRAVREGKVTARYYKIFQGESEPDYAAKAGRHYSNLFEAPVLFYAACLSALATHQATLLLQILAWAYVLVRVIHAYIHLGSNKIQRRINIFFLGWAVLLSMWIAVAVGATV